MDPRGNKEKIPRADLKISIIYSISKFMKNFNYKFEEVMEMEWFLFNELLGTLQTMELEAQNSTLKTLLEFNSIKHSKEFEKAYEDAIKRFDKNTERHVKIDTSRRDKYLLKKRIEDDRKRLVGAKMIKIGKGGV